MDFRYNASRSDGKTAYAGLNSAKQNHYTMCAGNQAAAKQTFDFQAMDCRYNASQSDGKTAYAGLNSAKQNHYTMCAGNLSAK